MAYSVNRIKNAYTALNTISTHINTISDVDKQKLINLVLDHASEDIIPVAMMIAHRNTYKLDYSIFMKCYELVFKDAVTMLKGSNELYGMEGMMLEPYKTMFMEEHLKTPTRIKYILVYNNLIRDYNGEIRVPYLTAEDTKLLLNRYIELKCNLHELLGNLRDNSYLRYLITPEIREKCIKIMLNHKYDIQEMFYTSNKYKDDELIRLIDAVIKKKMYNIINDIYTANYSFSFNVLGLVTEEQKEKLNAIRTAMKLMG